MDTVARMLGTVAGVGMVATLGMVAGVGMVWADMAWVATVGMVAGVDTRTAVPSVATVAGGRWSPTIL